MSSPMCGTYPLTGEQKCFTVFLMDETASQEQATPDSAAKGGRFRLLLFLFGLLILVVALLSIASLMQGKKQLQPTTESFKNPFKQETQNPFATESGYQNPFGTAGSGQQEYKNPFEQLR